MNYLTVLMKKHSCIAGTLLPSHEKGIQDLCKKASTLFIFAMRDHHSGDLPYREVAPSTQTQPFTF